MICHTKAMAALVEYGTRCLYEDTNCYSVFIVRSASWLKLKSSHIRKCCKENLPVTVCEKVVPKLNKRDGVIEWNSIKIAPPKLLLRGAVELLIVKGGGLGRCLWVKWTPAKDVSEHESGVKGHCKMTTSEIHFFTSSAVILWNVLTHLICFRKDQLNYLQALRTIAAAMVQHLYETEVRKLIICWSGVFSTGRVEWIQTARVVDLTARLKENDAIRSCVRTGDHGLQLHVVKTATKPLKTCKQSENYAQECAEWQRKKKVLFAFRN